ncbi:SOS response associated peptidase (SRAP) [Bifidobacterium sp. DSM 109958]|uniref:Abasic site processing protein n=1 Tax=Bifidobacterium moraviense TaxID=2675323 RepID=A0A7Y0F0K8_9BIFI|nr:SOS response-associated peptidase [Bifidobacterium sp. DSM 109958]NMM99809.1 SOS response associated peptidase (SRAP) [Bifidobacterium sp. DSM 109958]
MCRRFALDLDWDAVAGWLGVDAGDVRADRLPPRTFAVEPRQTIALVAQGGDGRRHLTGASWSLVPRWSQTDAPGYPTYNARVESIAYRPTFAESTRSMRAIIPASGYYEFKGRRPFYFHAPDGTPLAMAGLYSWWRPSGSRPWRLTATIVTCPAAEAFAAVHDRMPLLVAPDMAAAWLDRSVDGATLLPRMRESGMALSRGLGFHEVAPLAGDGPRLIAPLERRDPISLF